MKVREFAQFFRVARKRSRSEKDYIEFQRFQAQKVLESISETVNLRGKLILDIGCGRGGYTQVFGNAGANVISLDLEMPPVRKLFRAFVQGDATRLPFKSETFDFVYSSSLIEHLPDPKLLIDEVKRVMKKDAVFYLSFPPFYTPVGGHQFKPFNMFLPERLATAAARAIYGVRSHRYNDRFGKLYIMTIRKAKLLIRKSSMKIFKIKTRFLKLNFARIPLLNELMTWHVEFYIRK